MTEPLPLPPKMKKIHADYASLTRWETKLEVGVQVYVRWTNSNNAWMGQGVVERVNAKSVRVRLVEDVGSYPAGQTIVVPKTINYARWSWNNCVVPLDAVKEV